MMGATIATISAAYAFLTGDLNGDGIPDLIAEMATPSFSYEVNAYLGDGNGNFSQASSTGVPGFNCMALADFNHDGHLDFATSAGLLALGNGDGTFQTPVQILNAAGLTWVATGDLNGDGWADLVFTDSTSNSLYVLINNQQGGFNQSVISTASTAPGPFVIVLGDLNGDGILDAAVGTSTPYTPGMSALFFGDGKGGFAYQQTLAGGAPVAIQDVNGDGIPDIMATGDRANAEVFAGIGNGMFQTPVYFGPDIGVLVLGNFDGQPASAGKPDIMTPSLNGVFALLNTTL